MWISKQEYQSLIKRVENAEKNIREIEERINDKIFQVAKKILREPDKLSEEINREEAISQYIEEITSH